MSYLVKKLERIALSSQNGQKFFRRGVKSGLLADYEWGLGMCAKAWIYNLKQAFPNETLCVADIGGHAGTAASELNEIEGVRAFVIDIDPSIPTRGKALPRSRFIVGDIESLAGVPDNTFHGMMSFNCLGVTDIPRSFSEIFRILRPGGIALLDDEFWSLHPQRLLEIEPDIRKYIKASGTLGFAGTLESFLWNMKSLKKKSFRRKIRRRMHCRHGISLWPNRVCFELCKPAP